MLCNKINDVWFNDLMICYTEQEIFKSFDDVDIIRTFISMSSGATYQQRKLERRAILVITIMVGNYIHVFRKNVL
ncbi:transmembrane protein, putative [Medicago truncatula]|uniref:Transmembrane protein, putative n=1 Tax=Medicago truncatula TaxID=3880 RepID=G7JRD5_MEDTR|nr:transmembrane protein, putative [Medicago truncatula]